MFSILAALPATWGAIEPGSGKLSGSMRAETLGDYDVTTSADESAARITLPDGTIITVPEESDPTAIFRVTDPESIVVASQAFSWNASYNKNVYSREWTALAGTNVRIRISSLTGCADTSGNNTPQYLYLMRRYPLGIWNSVGSARSLTCGQSANYVWNNVTAGTYRFMLWDNTISPSHTKSASGSVTYNR